MSIFYVTGDSTDTSGYTANDKMRFINNGTTGEYGLQIRLVNGTGVTTSIGYLVEPKNGSDLTFEYVAVNDPDIIGVVAEKVATSSNCWLWIQGVANVFIQSSASAGMFVRSVATGDASTAAGLATGEVVPVSPFATDKHFQEVGHCIQGTSATGVALCVLHFN